MKKNFAMRVAAILLVVTMLSLCMVSATYAKYTTKYDSTDSARVAKWGFDTYTTITITDLFKNAYDGSVSSQVDVIAPGTAGEDSFALVPETGLAPEVKYTLTYSAAGSTCDDAIENNTNIIWKLNGKKVGTNGSWDELLTAINALTETYKAGTAPNAVHTIGWEWTFSTDADGDTADKNMGNAADLADVTVKITVTATQVD